MLSLEDFSEAEKFKKLSEISGRFSLATARMLCQAFAPFIADALSSIWCRHVNYVPYWIVEFSSTVIVILLI